MKVSFVQISTGVEWAPEDSPQEIRSFSFLPYSVGVLATYAQRCAQQKHEFSFPIFKRLPLVDAVPLLENAEVVAFSLYVWNVNLSLAIAAEYKQRHPEGIVVVGGPQVPDQAEDFMREHPFVDFACHGEGEETFTQLLDALEKGKGWSSVESLTYRGENGEALTNARRPRLVDLDEIPSPFLTGIFDELMKDSTDDWLMTWETNRGCPFSCTFCDWGSATAAKVFRFGMDRLEKELWWMAEHRIRFVFCCDANFGMLPRDLEIAKNALEVKRATGFPWSLSVQNTKNARERAYQVQSLIAKELNGTGVTLSLQSTSAETLEHIKRKNISTAAFKDLQQRFTQDGVVTYTDIILGLAGDTYAAFTASISEVVASGQHNNIEFYNCSILPNAEMGDPKYQKKYGLESVPQRITEVWDAAGKVEEVPEYLDIVVATAAMPAADWRRAKVFSWMTSLVYFDRLLQVPLAVLSKHLGVALQDFIEVLLAADGVHYPVISGLVDEMNDHANAIQHGGEEFRHCLELGSLLMPADHFALAKLVLGGEQEAFYAEAEAILGGYLSKEGWQDSRQLLSDLVTYNQAAYRVPGDQKDELLVLAHPVKELFARAIAGGRLVPEQRWATYTVAKSKQPMAGFEEFLINIARGQGKDKTGYLFEVSPIVLGEREKSCAGRLVGVSSLLHYSMEK